MRRGDITAVCVCVALTLLGTAIGLLVAANHPDLPAAQGRADREFGPANKPPAVDEV